MQIFECWYLLMFWVEWWENLIPEKQPRVLLLLPVWPAFHLAIAPWERMPLFSACTGSLNSRTTREDISIFSLSSPISFRWVLGSSKIIAWKKQVRSTHNNFLHTFTHIFESLDLYFNWFKNICFHYLGNNYIQTKIKCQWLYLEKLQVLQKYFKSFPLNNSSVLYTEQTEPWALPYPPTAVFPSGFVPARGSGIWGQTCWIWELPADKYTSFPPLCIILLLLSSPLISYFPSGPPHLWLRLFFSCAAFLLQIRQPHKRAYRLCCSKKPISSYARIDTNSKRSLWIFSVSFHNMI